MIRAAPQRAIIAGWKKPVKAMQKRKSWRGPSCIFFVQCLNHKLSFFRQTEKNPKGKKHALRCAEGSHTASEHTYPAPRGVFLRWPALPAGTFDAP